MNFSGLSFDRGWSLFLDRDGVINRRIIGGYVATYSDFAFLDGVLDSLVSLSGIFGRIIVVSNQQGVGKGLMTLAEVREIHAGMQSDVERAGGRIDGIYFSPYLAEENHPDRKPGIGMALRAKQDFPEIDFRRSVMVGDSATDMEFGKRAGMITVLISPDPAGAGEIQSDLVFPGLSEFTSAIEKTKKV